MKVSYTIPVRTPSASNLREHWRARHRRTKAQRRAAYYASLAAGVPLARESATVRMTRVSPRRLDDDNVRGALKAVRDGIADALGVDDADERVRWEYDQSVSRKAHVVVDVQC